MHFSELITIARIEDVEATGPELEAWLLESADSVSTALVPGDFEAIRQRVHARLGGMAE